MPDALHRMCSYGTTCPNFAITGKSYCVEHLQSIDSRRESACRRGYGRRHQRQRKLILHRDPICRACGAAPSVVADHIVDISDGGSATAMSNLQGLCESCHAIKSGERAHRKMKERAG